MKVYKMAMINDNWITDQVKFKCQQKFIYKFIFSNSFTKSDLVQLTCIISSLILVAS